ncbi:MAG: hypothetical protein WA823_01420 [Candidatus Acidiferrales bacterium]
MSLLLPDGQPLRLGVPLLGMANLWGSGLTKSTAQASSSTWRAEA